MRKLLMIAACVLGAGAGRAQATPIFFDDFSSYTSAHATAQQLGTGLTIDAAGSLADWTATGQHVVHGVDRSGAGDWAAMLWGADGTADGSANAITMRTAVAANTLGQSYAVSFLAGAAVYTTASQATKAGDYLEFYVLNAMGAVVASDRYDTAAWTGNPVNPFTAGAFTYTGNGSGAVRVEIQAVAPNGDFAGAIDDFGINAVSVPEPASAALLVGGLGLTLLLRRRRRR